jgi:hypothetical protein
VVVVIIYRKNVGALCGLCIIMALADWFPNYIVGTATSIVVNYRVCTTW